MRGCSPPRCSVRLACSRCCVVAPPSAHACVCCVLTFSALAHTSTRSPTRYGSTIAALLLLSLSLVGSALHPRQSEKMQHHHFNIHVTRLFRSVEQERGGEERRKGADEGDTDARERLTPPL